MKTTTIAIRYMLLHAVLSTLLATWPQASGVVIRLVDVAEEAGITVLNFGDYEAGPSMSRFVARLANGGTCRAAILRASPSTTDGTNGLG